MAGKVIELLDGDAEERLLRIDFFPVITDSVEEEIEGDILGEHWSVSGGIDLALAEIVEFARSQAELFCQICLFCDPYHRI